MLINKNFKGGLVMKKSLISLILVVVFLFGCADSKELCTRDDKGFKDTCTVFEPYGFFNSDDYKNPEVKYRANVGNIVWSIIFAPSVAIPVAILGLDMFEPVGWKDPDKVKGEK